MLIEGRFGHYMKQLLIPHETVVNPT